MEQLVVVVHAVAVRVPQTRVGSGIRTCGDAVLLTGCGVRREAGGAQHHAVAGLFVVRAGVDAPRILRQQIPGLGRTGEVAEVAIAESLATIRGEPREASRAGRLEELGAVPRLHGKEPHVFARTGQTVGQVAAHERRLRVVVAEVAERLDEVLLEVLETVVVEVEVTRRARAGIPRAGRHGIAVERAVHAGRDVGAAA